MLPVSYQKSTLETDPSFLVFHCCKCEGRTQVREKGDSVDN